MRRGVGELGAQQPASSAVVETLPALEKFPVTVEADNGSVTIEETPEAIVSLSATATESLFAIGAGDQVLAVDDQSNYPAEAPVTDLSGFEPNVEAIAGYEPTSSSPPTIPAGSWTASRSSTFRCSSRMPPRTSTPPTSRSERSEWPRETWRAPIEVVTSMQIEIEQLVASVPGAHGATVYHELGPDFPRPPRRRSSAASTSSSGS